MSAGAFGALTGQVDLDFPEQDAALSEPLKDTHCGSRRNGARTSASAATSE